MSTSFRYAPHQRADERLETGPPTVAAAARRMHGSGPIGRLNAAVGLKITGAPAALASGNALVIVAWIGQNVQAASSDKRAEATYDDATMILAEVRQIQAHLIAQDAELERLRADLATRPGGPAGRG